MTTATLGGQPMAYATTAINSEATMRTGVLQSMKKLAADNAETLAAIMAKHGEKISSTPLTQQPYTVLKFGGDNIEITGFYTRVSEDMLMPPLVWGNPSEIQVRTFRKALLLCQICVQSIDTAPAGIIRQPSNIVALPSRLFPLEVHPDHR